MKSLALALVASAALSLTGCGQGQLPPKEAQRLNEVMSKGLTAPGHGPVGAGQAKHGKPLGQPPAVPAGN